jgi:hypothetical protein
MSFSELTQDALETHADWFAVDVLYRDNSKAATIEVPAVVYPEYTRTKRVATGWNKAISREFMIQIDDLATPLVKGQILHEDRIYMIDQVVKSRSGRWQLTCDRETAGEVSRPGYRGPNQ